MTVGELITMLQMVNDREAETGVLYYDDTAPRHLDMIAGLNINGPVVELVCCESMFRALNAPGYPPKGMVDR